MSTNDLTGMYEDTPEELMKSLIQMVKQAVNKIGMGSAQRGYADPVRTASMLDNVADSLEAKGLIKEAEELDVIANTLEMRMAANVIYTGIFFDSNDPGLKDEKKSGPFCET